MIQVFKDEKSMIAHLRGKDTQIKHEAVPVEEIKKKKSGKKKSGKKKEK